MPNCIGSYCKLVGKLLYLTTSRPVISFAIQQLSQFLNRPTVTHYHAACQVLRYLKGNPGRGLFFPREVLCKFLGSQMLIGQVALILGGLHRGTFFYWFILNFLACKEAANCIQVFL